MTPVTQIWDNSFGHAKLKVERANKHIADIEERVRRSPDAYAPSLKIDLKTGQQFVQYGLTDRTLQPDLALIIGDAVHNLKCALDFTWCGTIRVLLPSALSGQSKFPIYEPRGSPKSGHVGSLQNRPC